MPSSSIKSSVSNLIRGYFPELKIINNSIEIIEEDLKIVIKINPEEKSLVVIENDTSLEKNIKRRRRIIFKVFNLVQDLYLSDDFDSVFISDGKKEIKL